METEPVEPEEEQVVETVQVTDRELALEAAPALEADLSLTLKEVW
jgi:hypothetical protein